MGKKNFTKRFTDHAVQRWKEKILMLAALESSIQADIKTFSELTGVKILDVQLFDSQTGEIQFEVDI